MLFRLSIEEKVLGIGAITVLVGTFLPWHSTMFNYKEKAITTSGFAGDLGVIGFIVFILTAMTLFYLMSDNMNIKIPSFGHKKDKINLFLIGQSAFLLLLTIAIYTKRSIDYTNAEIRFGLYISLIGACIGAFASFAQIQKSNKKDVQEFFDHSEEGAANKADDNKIKTLDKNLEVIEGKKEEDADDTSKAEQKSFFYEEKEENIEKESIDTVEAIHESSQDKNTDIQQPEDPAIEMPKIPDNAIIDTSPKEKVETIQEPSPVKDVKDIKEKESIIEKSKEIEEKIKQKKEIEKKVDYNKPSDQGNYFMRDAGINNEPEVKKEVKEVVEKEEVAEKKEVIEKKEVVEKKSDTNTKQNRSIKIDLESIKPVNKDTKKKVEKKDVAEKKEPANQNMSFYDDL